VSVYGTYVGVHSRPVGKRPRLASCERCGIRHDTKDRKKDAHPVPGLLRGRESHG
jgi:hypothetical protein